MSGLMRPLRPPHALDVVLLAVGLALAPALTNPVAAQQRPRHPACVRCHLDLEDERLAQPARDYATDIHAQRGFGCLECHGATAREAAELETAAGFLSAPERQNIPALCGRCHSDGAFMRDYNPSLRVDQVQEYYTSAHGRQLRERADPDVATCTDCHPAHTMRPPSDPESSVYAASVADLCADCHGDPQHMAGRDLPTDQRERWAVSVHGRMMIEDGDVTAPTCNDCHGNHGAAPPGVFSVGNVCGQCHAVMADLFNGSAHVDVFAEAGLPGCATCHNNHAIFPTSDSLLVERAATVCADCHPPSDEYGDEFLIVAELIDSLKTEYDRAEQILEEAENKGMEVSQPLFELQEATNALTKARSAVHAFKVEPVAEEIEAGLAITARAHGRGEEALDEHEFRRVGLAVSASIILLLIGGIMLKIRQIESRQAAGSGQRS